MSEFTKGPWVKDYNGTRGHIKAMVDPESGNTPTVLRFDVCTPSLSDEDKEAIGRMAAQAPAMYEVIKKVRSELQVDLEVFEGFERRMDLSDLKAELSELNAIIADVEGE